MSRIVEIDFFRINCLAGNQTEAFEEFGCHLAAAEKPTGARYDRFRGGGGDGGVEALYTFPDGGKWGFQSKLVGSKSVRAQVQKSVDAVLKTHPTLRRYTILLPFDPTGKVAGRAGKSESERLEAYRSEWRIQAQERGMDVEFEYWFRSGLLDRFLRLDPSGGRLLFWFGEMVLDGGWFARHARERVAALEPNYRPPLARPHHAHAALASLGLTPEFGHWMRKIRYWVRRATWYVHQAQPLGAPDVAELHGKLQELDAIIEECAARPAVRLLERAEELTEDLRARGPALLAARIPDPDGGKAPDKGLTVTLMQVRSELSSLPPRLACERAILLTGESGVGKTHTLCTEVRERSAVGLPSVLLSARGFEGEPWVRIRDTLGLPGSIGCDQMFSMLDAAGQAAGYPCVVFIDTLNETDPRSYWQQQLPALLQTIAPYEWLRLCVVCRTSYLQAVLGAWRGIVQVEHEGIAGSAGYLAFFDEYGLEAPAMPPLGPEATNPGYLHLVCTAARGAGARHLAARRDGMADVIDAVLDAKNRAISARLRISAHERQVHEGVRALAAAMLAGGAQRLAYRDALRAVSAATGERLGRDLLDELVREDLLSIEEAQAPAGAPTAEVRFRFERMGDHLRAQEILSRLDGADSVRTAFAANGSIYPLVADGPSIAASRGLVEALAVQLPELAGLELSEVAPASVRAELLPLVLESLLWRTPGSVGPAAVAVADEALGSPALAEHALNVLFSIGVRAMHPLNAEWLHQRLASLPMPERDVLLSRVLQPWNNESPVTRLLDWAEEGAVAGADPDTARLASILTAWVCGAPEADQREQATRAMLRLFQHHPAIAADVLERFSTVEDELVAEQHLAAVYAVLLHDPGAEHARELAALVARRRYVPAWENHAVRWYALGISALRGTGPAGAPPPPATAAAPSSVAPRATPRAAPGRNDVALIDEALRRSSLAKALVGELHAAGFPREPRWIRNGIAREMWELGYNDQRFGQRDRGIFAMTEEDDLEIGGPSAAKYLRVAVCRLIGRLSDWGSPLLHLLLEGDARLVPRLPASVKRLVRESDLSIAGWTPPNAEADAWWLPRESPFWGAAETRIWDDGPRWPGAGMPDPAGLVTADDPETPRAWAVLFGQRQWNLEEPGAEIGWGRRVVTLTIRSYLARRKDRAAVDTLLGDADWVERLPSSAEWLAMWVGEYPRYRDAGTRVEAEEEGGAGPLQPTMEPRVGAGWRPRYDDRMVPLPGAAFLGKRKPLAWRADGTYTLPDGSVCLRHPDATEHGPPALLAEWGYLRHFLRTKSLDLLWVAELDDSAEAYGDPLANEVRASMAWAIRLERGKALVVATHVAPADS
ncbi:MAG TPA: hypothetical protein VGB24_14305 [Longimicrobium sp.]|jgi:hypothetical protein|uniref:hypothetical protein n=1 Tax=Longimicrobium sp. TaxID=2029185 RepID=UPI002EDB08C7